MTGKGPGNVRPELDPGGGRPDDKGKHKAMNRTIKLVLIVSGVLLLAALLTDFMRSRPGQQPVNPFAYDIEAFRQVDEALITFRETKQIRLNVDGPAGIACCGELIWLISSDLLQAITFSGEEVLRVASAGLPAAITTTPDKGVLVAYNNFVAEYDREGQELRRSTHRDPPASFTGVTVSEEHVFVADAGSRQVLVYDRELQLTGSFRGESGVSEVHGLVLPGVCFDLAVDMDDWLWVVNPGIHSIQQYTPGGRLRTQWGDASFATEGFSGCCNPVFLHVMPDGRFLTSEKGLVRIKLYHPSGTFEAVVAPPAAFEGGLNAPALATDGEGNVLALDFDKNMIRFFEPNPTE